MLKKLTYLMLALLLISMVATFSAVPALAAVPLTVNKVLLGGGPDEVFTFQCWRDLNNNNVIDAGDLHVGDVVIDTSVTNTGSISLSILGKYVIREVLIPGSEYAPPPVDQVVQVSCPASVTFENSWVPPTGEGTLTIYKVDEDGVLLAGSVFKIEPNPYDGAELIVTDNDVGIDMNPTDGVITLVNVPYGTYTITEVTAPAGYEPGPPQTVVVDDTTPIVEVTYVNKLGSIEILKVDGSGAPLAGATFVIEPDPKTGVVGSSLMVVDNGLNDEDMTEGTLLITDALIDICYTITETVAPPGYDLAPPQTVCLTSSAKVTVNFVNTPTTEEGGTPGFWSSPAAVMKFGTAQLASWFRTIVLDSKWFEDTLAVGTDQEVYDAMIFILKNTGAKAYTGAVNQFRCQYLATRLNAMSGRLGLGTVHDISGVYGAAACFGYSSGTLSQIISTIESKETDGLIFTAPPSRDDVLIMKSVCDMLNNP